jgi:transcriptional antiterminator NusG
MSEDIEKQAVTPEETEAVNSEATSEETLPVSDSAEEAAVEAQAEPEEAEEPAEPAEEAAAEAQAEPEEAEEPAEPAEEGAVEAQAEPEEAEEPAEPAEEAAAEAQAEPEETEEPVEPAEEVAVEAQAEPEETEEPVEPAEEVAVEAQAETEEADEPAEAKAIPSPSSDPKYADMEWYVIHAHSGHENKVKQSLENRVRQEHLEATIGDILVPSEEVAEVKGGKKRIINRKIFPGYVLVRMKLSHQTWYLVRTTPGVTGFIGSGKNPTPLAPEEVESIFEQMRGEQKKPKPKVEFEKDERVKIIEGPFTNFMGTVDEVNAERGKLKVMVEIFERLTSVELEFWQVEKI